MDKNNYHIFDKMFKKILTLSEKSVINMINGLFDTDYPLDSEIEYHWTEFIDDELKKTLADTIITVNRYNVYHIEAQMYEDDDIVMRVFDYGYKHSIRNRRNPDVLQFPEPRVICFGDSRKVPDTYELIIDFGEQGQFNYKVKTFKYQEYTLEEINNKKMIILIPFELLRLRELLKKECNEENLKKLKTLVEDDIMGSIYKNYCLGNITGSDAGRLIQMTKRLYGYLYSEYNQMEVIDKMDESLILEYEDLDRKYAEIDRKQADYERRLKKYEGVKAEFRETVAKYEDTKVKYEDTKVKYEDTKVKYEDTKVKYEDTKAKYEDIKVKYEDIKVKYEDIKEEFQNTKTDYEARFRQQDEIIKQLMEEIELLKEKS